MSLRLEWDVHAERGEGPMQDGRERGVWVADIKACRRHRYGIKTGPALSPGGRTMCANKAQARTVFTYDHHAREIGNRRGFAEVKHGYRDRPSMDGASVLPIGLFSLRVEMSGLAHARIAE